jgi:hypothetical protein
MLSPLCVRRIDSAIVGETSMTASFAHPDACAPCGTVFVTTRRVIGSSLIFARFVSDSRPARAR